MTFEIYDYLVLGLAQLIVLFAYIYFARKTQIIDTPNHRSSHVKPTVRGGGILFPLTVLFVNIYYGFDYPWFMCGLLAISIISFWDDVSPLPYAPRMIVHILSVLLMVADLNLSVHWYFLLPIPFVAFVNACNFMDGINGITTTFGLAVFIVMLYIDVWMEQFVNPSYLILLILSVLVFSIFNFRKKALCFAGDVGSVSLSFIIGFLILLMIIQFKSVLFLGLVMVFAVDSSMTILYRMANRENLTKPHRTHLYQLLANELKISHLTVSSLYGVTQLSISIVLVMLMHLSLGLAAQLLVLLIAYIGMAAFYIWMRRRIRSAC